ncbi:MAG: hypothetical protein H6834_01290 [Planctomycetes bacterium]|nr:hypothetical protein [Planctomycetota bacterium]
MSLMHSVVAAVCVVCAATTPFGFAQDRGAEAPGPRQEEPAQGKQGEQRPETKKPDEPGAQESKKPELPKLPPNKKDELEELLKRFEKNAPTPEEASKILRREELERAREGAGASTTLPDTSKNGQDPATGNATADDESDFPSNPFLGTWMVTRITRPRAGLGNGSGYIIFTPSFMSMHLFLGSPTQEPQWQSSMRRYWVQGPLFVTASILGVQNSDDGESILLEEAGRRESRRFQFLGPDLLRISQGQRSYIDLRRVEWFGPAR